MNAVPTVLQQILKVFIPQMSQTIQCSSVVQYCELCRMVYNMYGRVVNATKEYSNGTIQKYDHVNKACCICGGS